MYKTNNVKDKIYQALYMGKILLLNDKERLHNLRAIAFQSRDFNWYFAHF